MAWRESLQRKITDTVVYGYAYPCIFPQKEVATNFRLRENISMSFIVLFCDTIISRRRKYQRRFARAPRKKTRPLGGLPILRLRVGFGEERA